LEQPQRECLHILCQMGKVNVMASTIPDEDDTSRSKLFSLPLFANSTPLEKLKKWLNRKKDSTAFDFILHSITQAQMGAHQSILLSIKIIFYFKTIRNIFCRPPSMASVLQLKQDCDYDLNGVMGEFPKLCLGILYPLVIQSLAKFCLVHIINSVLL
jgi:hypothetical protein